MVLLEIDVEGVSAFEGESYAPRAIHMDGVTDRPEAPQRVEIEARQIHVFRRGRGVQRVEAAKAPRMERLLDTGSRPFLEDLPQALAPEAPDHPLCVNHFDTFVNQ
jgi:hypothetical protein